jgi:hypothetical protein
MTENIEKKKTFFGFVKEHKKVIAIGTVTACAVIVGVVIFKNRTATNALNIQEIVAKGLKTQGDAISIGSEVVEVCHASNLPNNKLINVKEHLRNLPDGWKASQIKIDLAARYGFSLRDHQTWVNSYAKTAV